MREEDRARIATARFAWEEGARSLAQPGPLHEPRLRLAAAVRDELRRRVGTTFRLIQLVDAWEDASAWFLDLAPRVAPKNPEAWDPSIALDGAFASYARGATDARDELGSA